MWETYQAFSHELQQQRPSATVKPVALQYIAASATDVWNYVDGYFFKSVDDGIDKLKDFMYAEHARCPNERFAMAGYSQGAGVIHTVLRRLDQADPSMIGPQRLVAVILLADMAKTAYDQELLWETADTPATGGLVTASGLWDKGFGSDPSLTGPFANVATAQTIAMCHDHDMVCSPGRHSSFANHTNFVHRVRRARRVGERTRRMASSRKTGLLHDLVTS